MNSRLTRKSPSCIQIWSYAPPQAPEVEHEDDHVGRHAVVRCEMVLCIEGGPAHEIKWCPLPSHGKVSLLLTGLFVEFIEHLPSEGRG